MKLIFSAFFLFSVPAIALDFVTPPVSDAGDAYGASMAMDGDILVIGAPGEDGDTGISDNSLTDSGAAYVFSRKRDIWVFQAYLKASDRDFDAGFGSSVAVSGSTVVVGSPRRGIPSGGFFPDPAGAAYVFEKVNGVWAEQAKLLGSNTGDSDNFGISVAIDADTVVIGARFEAGLGNSQTDSGAAYVFSRNGTAWTEEAYLKASGASSFDEFGTSVAVSGNTVAVGAPFQDTAGQEAGSVVIFKKEAGWQQAVALYAPDAGAGDFFGTAIALSGEMLLVGARGEDDIAQGSGAGYVFTSSSGTWQQETRLKGLLGSQNSGFGTSVALEGERAICGAPGESKSGVNSGAIWSFHRDSGGWGSGKRILGNFQSAGDGFGGTVAVSGLKIAAGARGGDGAGDTLPDAGTAFSFGVAPDSFSEWVVSQDLSGDDALDAAIPRNDGVPNLLAYSLGLPVGSGGSGRLPALVWNGSTFLRPSAHPADITYIWQESEDLSTWINLASLESGGSWTGDFSGNVFDGISIGGLTRATVAHSRPALKLFLRLKVMRD